MMHELSILVATYSAYTVFKDFQFLIRIGYIILAFTILRFFPDSLKSLVQMTLVWIIADIVDAFVNLSKYEDEYKCTSTASISKNETIVEEVQEPSLTEKDSKWSSSPPRMDESTLQEDSTSAQPSTDAR
jgi:hypothetical protein